MPALGGISRALPGENYARFFLISFCDFFPLPLGYEYPINNSSWKRLSLSDARPLESQSRQPILISLDTKEQTAWTHIHWRDTKSGNSLFGGKDNWKHRQMVHGNSFGVTFKVSNLVFLPSFFLDGEKSMHHRGPVLWCLGQGQFITHIRLSYKTHD